jgi:hypothetical protein
MHAGRSKGRKNCGVNTFSRKRPSLAVDGHTIMNLPCITRAFRQF